MDVILSSKIKNMSVSRFLLLGILVMFTVSVAKSSILFNRSMDTVTPKLGPSKPRVIKINSWVRNIIEKPESAERMEQMIDERKLFVNVDTLKEESGMNLFNVNVNGIVHAPFFDTINTAYQFDKLLEVSGHFKRVKYDPSSEKLFIIVVLLPENAVENGGVH